jgi:anti-sigma B factor antagonist
MPESILDITVEHAGSEMLLKISGELDLSTAPSLRACIDTVDPNVPLLTIDMGEIRFIDSTGLGLLAGTHHALSSSGRRLEIQSARGHTRKLLEVTGLDQILVVVDDPVG